jgi:hypothetical protein
MSAALTDILIAAATLGAFLIVAEAAWRPLRRRYIDPPIVPGDPALWGRAAGMSGSGCVWFAVFVPLGLAACAAMNLLMERF